MPTPETRQAVIWEDGTPTFLSQVYIDSSHTLTAVQQAHVTSISYSVFRLDGTGPVTIASAQALVVADVVLNTLSTGTIWDVDDVGFNFKTAIAASNFATGDKTYLVEFKWTLTGGTVFWDQFKVYARSVQTS